MKACPICGLPTEKVCWHEPYEVKPIEVSTDGVLRLLWDWIQDCEKELEPHWRAYFKLKHGQDELQQKDTV